MPTSNLQGLNIVHPPTNDSDSQDLLSGTPFPDLTAQLDLWTNLPFDHEEAPAREEDRLGRKAVDEAEEDEEPNSAGARAATIQDGHAEVVTGTNIGSNVGNTLQPQTLTFDLNALLVGFGIDPFVAAAASASQQPAAVVPSLAQLLALSAHAQAQMFQQPPPPAPGPASTSSTNTSTTVQRSIEDTQPAKRARTRKASVTTAEAASGSYADNTTTPLSVAEDKRRRNTAASARFRLKKKEREAALESKAKELESKVSELERECETLRRENGWLKGLVVGVTGAAAQGSVPVSIPSIGSFTTTSGTKRPRSDESDRNGHQ